MVLTKERIAIMSLAFGFRFVYGWYSGVDWSKPSVPTALFFMWSCTIAVAIGFAVKPVQQKTRYGRRITDRKSPLVKETTERPSNE